MIERQKIHSVLGDRALVVEHIGSTSVVGLAAKAIVDICLAVSDSSDEAAYVPDLEALGYSIRVRGRTGTSTACCGLRPATSISTSSPPVRGRSSGTSFFVTGCAATLADRGLYESTKRVLAQQEWESMDDYATAKSDVVEEILARARPCRVGVRSRTCMTRMTRL